MDFLEGFKKYITYAKKIGFETVYSSIILGLPTETLAEGRETVRFSVPTNLYTSYYRKVTEDRSETLTPFQMHETGEYSISSPWKKKPPGKGAVDHATDKRPVPYVVFLLPWGKNSTAGCAKILIPKHPPE